MITDFSIKCLGECRFDSPLESVVFIDDNDGVLADSSISGFREWRDNPPVMEKAGPRKQVFFDPNISRAGIVTCGGLCPGINAVIRAIVMVLWYRYGVREVLGLRYGYEGLVPSNGHEPMLLTPEVVEDCHQHGGTILGSSRGPQDFGKMVDFLLAKRINMLFTIGGDGTQRGALSISQEIERRNLPISVIGIPKTIDNDIPYTDRTFGFETAVAMSRGPITSAHMEAKGAQNGVGLVKLMGRESGFVAAYGSLASSDVNLVLVPESPFSLERVLSFLEQRLEQRGHAVVVVAEGAGADLVPVLGEDASGNVKRGDIGTFLKSAIKQHFEEKNIPITVKYIDPSYIIRSAPASADDSVFCFQLGSAAVHAAMSGRTGMVVSLWGGNLVHVPIELAGNDRKQIDTHGLLWQNVLDNTGQPESFL